MRPAVLLLLCGLLAPALAQAQEVGEEVGEVKKIREASGIENQKPLLLVEHGPVRVGLTVTLGKPVSFIDLALDKRITAGLREMDFQVWGSFHFEGIGEFTIEKAEAEQTTGRILLGLLVPQGKLWMTALSQLVLHQVWIQTPELKAFPEGTTFRMLVDPVVGTFLATDEGSVRAELTGSDEKGETFLVTAGHWLLVPPAGVIQRGSSTDPRDILDDPPGLDCCDFRTGPPEP